MLKIFFFQDESLPNDVEQNLEKNYAKMLEVISKIDGKLFETGNHLNDFEVDNQLREHDSNDENLALKAPELEKIGMENPKPAVNEIEVEVNGINEKNSFAVIEPPDTNAEAIADLKHSENVVRILKDVTKSSNQREVLPLAAGPVEVSPSPEQPAADAPNGSANEKKKTHRKLAGKKVAVRFDSDGDSIYDDSEEEIKPAKNCKQKKAQPTTKKLVHGQQKVVELPLNDEDLIDPLNEASSDERDESSEFFADDGVPVINIPLADLLKQNGFRLHRISESEESNERKQQVVPNFEDSSSEL